MSARVAVAGVLIAGSTHVEALPLRCPTGDPQLDDPDLRAFLTESEFPSSNPTGQPETSRREVGGQIYDSSGVLIVVRDSVSFAGNCSRTIFIHTDRVLIPFQSALNQMARRRCIPSSHTTRLRAKTTGRDLIAFGRG
jgi:hypothetical protein